MAFNYDRLLWYNAGPTKVLSQSNGVAGEVINICLFLPLLDSSMSGAQSVLVIAVLQQQDIYLNCDRDYTIDVHSIGEL